MTKTKQIVCVTVCMALAAGFASAATVQTDHNPSVNFSTYKTYAWRAKPPSEEADPTGNFRKLHRLVLQTADDELKDRGYVLTEDDPDFYLSYSAVANASMFLNQIVVEGGWRVGRMEAYANGNLIIEFLDGDSGKAIWRGWASDGVNPKKMDTRVPKFVRKILKKFPPPAGQN